MFARLLATFGAVALALSLAGIVSADTGNVATNSIGSVQASALSTAPAVSSATPDSTVSSALPTSIASDNGNTSDGSAGSAQLGGGNTATNSIGSGQLATTNTAPSLVATVLGHKTNASGTGTAGNPSNSVSKGLVTLQPGNPSVAGTASTDTHVVNKSTVKAAVKGARTSVHSVAVPKVTTGPGRSGAGDVSASATPQVTQHVSTNLRSATVRPAVAVTPNIQAGVGQTAQTQSGGTVGLAQNQGDTASHSFGTVQGGALTASPMFAFMSPSRELALMLGGSSGVDGGSPNSASDSIGTVQIGSGNETDPSLGTVQVGSLHLGPTANLSSPNGNTGIGGSTGIAGGNNTANNSNGTVQIGGNTTNGSTGSLQVAPVSENEQGSFGNTPAGGGTVSAPEQIGSGTVPNTATHSVGSVQVGAGNTSTGSIGTLQFGGRSPSTTTPPTTPPGGETTGPTTGPGTDTGGTPEPGAPAAGTPGSGTPAAAAATGAAPRVPLSGAQSATAAAPAKTAAASTAASPSRSGASRASSAANAGSPSTPSAAAPSSGTSVLGQTLPFTGFALALACMIGLGLLGVGTAVRKLVAAN
ncbi:MAG TPA: hypothetical protein VG652_06115 [Gaiellaceae bacterium]|nr:hypothetical protein [Gaiellaceae bacterium]